MTTTFDEPRIELVFGSIFNQWVDAIVNPANMQMRHGGGLAALIAQTGGDEVVRESQAQIPVPTGSAIVTSAGLLSPVFKGIIHTVGPIYDDGESGEPGLLACAYKSAMDRAAEKEWTSVAFPAISCGVFRYPVEEAAPIAIAALQESLRVHPSIEQVLICLLDEYHMKAFTEALDSEVNDR